MPNGGIVASQTLLPLTGKRSAKYYALGQPNPRQTRDWRSCRQAKHIGVPGQNRELTGKSVPASFEHPVRKVLLRRSARLTVRVRWQASISPSADQKSPNGHFFCFNSRRKAPRLVKRKSEAEASSAFSLSASRSQLSRNQLRGVMDCCLNQSRA